jgi:hypothetical protein
MGYSLLLFAQIHPSIFSSLLAFYLHFYVFENRGLFHSVQLGMVFLLFLLAFQSMQATMFFSMIPLSYLTLTKWEKYKGKILGFLVICVSAFVFSSIIYSLSLAHWHSLGNTGYELGEQVVAASMNNPLLILKTFINPYTYWSAFKIWSYPYPFHFTLPINDDTKAKMALVVFIIWILLVILTVVHEFRENSGHRKNQIIYKWLAAFSGLGLGAVIIVLDSPLEIIEHRAHINLTFVGVIIFIGGYSFQVLKSRYSILEKKFVAYTGAFMILLVAFGAQSNVLRGIVVPRMENINFIRTELASKNPDDYTHIIVVLPSWRECITEPCEPWVGYVAGGTYHMTREGVYRYALSTMGINPESKNIEFLQENPGDISRGSIIVNWEKFIMARKNQLDKGVLP